MLIRASGKFAVRVRHQKPADIFLKWYWKLLQITNICEILPIPSDPLIEDIGYLLEQFADL
jgi:hypothetical protein